MHWPMHKTAENEISRLNEGFDSKSAYTTDHGNIMMNFSYGEKLRQTVKYVCIMWRKL